MKKDWDKGGTDRQTFELLTSRRCGLNFVHIFKNGGTAVGRYALNSKDTKNSEFYYLTENRQADIKSRMKMKALLSGPSGAQYFTISIVNQDPLARFISGFGEILGRWKQRKGQYKLLKDVLSIDSFPEAILKNAFDLREMKGSLHWPEIWHVAPQVAFLVNGLGDPLDIDYIGHVERLEEEISFFFNISDIKLAKVHGAGRKKASPTSGRTPGSLASKTQLQICKILAVDYCCFGFPLPKACSSIRDPCFPEI